MVSVQLRAQPSTKLRPGPAKQRIAPARSRHLRRPILVVLVLVVGLLLARTVFEWIHYRCTHIVSHDARIKGIVTELGTRIVGRIRTIEVEPGQRIYRCSCGTVLHCVDDPDVPEEERLECARMVPTCPHCNEAIEFEEGLSWQPEF